MNKFSFIQNDTILKIVVLFVICLTYSFFQAFIILCFSLALCYLFRRKQIDHSDVRTIDNDIILSPISGRVNEIKHTEDTTIIKLSSSWLKNYGLYLPLDCEFIKVEECVGLRNIVKNYNLKTYSTDILMRNELNQEVGVSLESSAIIFKPRVWTMAGDLGTRGANIGFIPFGGQVIIKLPKQTKVLVSTNDLVLSAQTLLASIDKE